MTKRSVREVGEQIALEQLHEGRGVAVDVVRAGAVEVRVARGRHVDHRRHVQLHHRLVERIPPAVRERRVGPVAAGRVGVEVACRRSRARSTQRRSSGDAVGGRHAGRLRQLADAGEVAREHPAGAMRSGRCIRASRRRWPPRSTRWWPMPAARGEKMVRSVPRSRWMRSWPRSMLPRIWSSVMTGRGGTAGAVASPPGDLGGAPGFVLLRRGGVVAVAVDDHRLLPCGPPGNGAGQSATSRSGGVTRILSAITTDTAKKPAITSRA